MNITTEKSTVSQQTIETDKTPYKRPDLRVYGSVKHLTKANNGSATDKNANNPGNIPSDRSVKENIMKIDVHPLGIGLYLFDYKPEFRDACGHERQFGVMADEVETVMPEAVSVHPDGYKQVDYTMLGINNRVH